MIDPPIRRIYIEKSVRDTAVTRNVLRNKGAIPVEYVERSRDVIAQHQRGQGPRSHLRGKRALLLSDYRCEPVKPCPCSPGCVSCDYQILNIGVGCPLDCSYCYLQSFLSNPLLVIQANSDALLAAVGEELRAHPDRFYRLGTGEYTDSLALEPLTGYASLLVEFIREFPNAVLELKTKAARVESLLGLDHRGRTVCAWSVNSERICAEEEHRTASLAERIDAARRCRRAGYKIAFHFDPIFYYEGWEEEYHETVGRIFDAVPAERIAWISLGAFRYTPGLQEIIRARFPHNPYTYGELISGADGKMRYPRPLRTHIYRKMVDWILDAGGMRKMIYLCMESGAVWRDALGHDPHDQAELGRWLDERCIA